MSNRAALRKLSKRFPAPPEIERIMDSLRDGTDLSAAIIATAILEASLEKLLVKKFTYKYPDLVGQIFTNRGPLADFHSKILIANAFGIITSNLAGELHSIKAIRNTFAHTKFPISFDHEYVGREVASLRALTAIKEAESESKKKLVLDNKEWFLLITRIILIMFESLDKHPGNADEAIRDALADKPPSTSSQ